MRASVRRRASGLVLRVMTHDCTAAAAGDSPELMAGFPPAPESRVTLANWQDPPFNRWAFRHMRELIPTQPIPAGPGTARQLPASRGQLGNPPVTRPDGSKTTLADVLAGTYTDALVVLHEGQLVAERYEAGMTTGRPHLLMSVSKSIVGCVAGVLAGQGLLDTRALVTSYVPEVSGSGYAGAAVRDLLDMRTGVAFRETYTDPDAEVRVMERSMGWRPAQPGDPVCDAILEPFRRKQLLDGFARAWPSAEPVGNARQATTAAEAAR